MMFIARFSPRRSQHGSFSCRAEARTRRLVFRTLWSTDCFAIGASIAHIRRTARKDRPVDKLDRYREIVRRVIEDYASYKPSHGEIDTEAIIDPAKDHYEVMHVGW